MEISNHDSDPRTEILQEGFGRHLWDVPISDIIAPTTLKVRDLQRSSTCSSADRLQITYVGSVFSVLPFVFVKTGLFILYWTIFKPFRWLRFGIIAGASAVVSVYTACIIAILYGDAPARGILFLYSQKLSIPIAAFTLASDLYLLVLPIAAVMNLKISRSRKYSLALVFTAGIG